MERDAMNDSDRTIDEGQRGPRSRKPGDETLGRDSEHTLERFDEPDQTIEAEATIVHGTITPRIRAMAATSNGPALEPGARLGSYVLVSQLGEGAQGSVWRAHNEVADRDFALKFLTAKQNRNEAAVRSMRAEAAVLFTLTHPSIVRLNNIEQVGPHLFLVMELIQGPSVQALLSERLPKKGAKRRGFSAEECLWLLEQLAPALDYAASQKVTHRDIKPANLMLTAEVDAERPLTESRAQVKLCDFGIAIVELESSSTDRMRPAGTLPYMAPEVLQGEKPTTQSDIYSLAATLYALHRGDPPYKGGTIPEMMKRHSEGVLLPLESGNKAFDAAVMKALSKRAEDRQATFDDFLYDASGGRLGKRAALRARGQRRATIAASVLALTAIGYALDPFGVRRGQAEFVLGSTLGTRAGAPVVRSGALDVEFLYSSPGDEEVQVQVNGLDVVTIGPVAPGGDRYEAVVTFADHGSYEVTLRGTERGSVIGQQLYFVDTKVELAEPALELPEPGPYDVESPVLVDFYIDEPNVEVSDISLGGVEPLALEVDGIRARARLRIPTDPERQSWEVARRFRFRDPFGNEAERSISFEAFDRQRILAGIHRGEPTPVEEVHLWDVDEELEMIDTLERNLETAAKWIDFAERESLAGKAEERRVALGALRAAAPTPTIEWLHGEARDGWYVADDGIDVPLLYTRNSSPELVGHVRHSRSSEIVATVEGAGLTIDVAPEIERSTGKFQLVVKLPRDGEGSVKLALPDNGPIKNLRLAYDSEPPRIELESPLSGQSVAANSVLVTAKIIDAVSGVAKAELIVAGAETSELERVAGGDTSWRGDVKLPREGQNSCVLRAWDRVGNSFEHQFSLERDTTAPTWQPSEDPPIASTGWPASMLLQFDEPVHRARAEWRLLDSEQDVVGKGRFVNGEIEPVQSTVKFSIDLPFIACSQLEVDVWVADALENERQVKVTRAVRHDPWGAVPEGIRTRAEAILDPGELRRLLGDELGAADKVYVTDADGRRFPRCIRHTLSTIEFVFVPGGSFTYGDAAGKRVEMSGFYIARTEVSNRQFDPISFGYTPTGDDELDRPVRTNRADAGRWCAQHQFKLPTEAQWEYAASGPEDRVYPWGDEFDFKRRNGPPSSRTEPRPTQAAVDSFEKGRSWCGALQMAGNVLEVCRDELDPETVRADVTDPIGTIDATNLVHPIRGSSTTTDPIYEPTYARYVFTAKSRTERRVGFRPVWEVRD
jgi:hypothetical protein